MLKINPQRLLATLRRLAEFGKCGTGVDRPAYSQADIKARRWLLGEMQDAGLEARMDGFGNVYGKAKGVSKTVLVGSHTDTVPEGGWLDGALGVVYGLEIARAWNADRSGSERGVDVISFADEEGSYRGCLGSNAFCGTLGDFDARRTVNLAGRSLAEALREAGLDGQGRFTRDPGRHRAYLEAHVEQGPQLEAEGKPVGIVTGIVGIRRYLLTFRGQADHAGTTPMDMRKDAGAALIRVASTLLERFVAEGAAATVWNLGNITLKPGAANVVPAEAELFLEFRDTSADLLPRLEEMVEASAAAWNRDSLVRCEARRTFTVEPVAMDPDLAETVRAAAERCGAEAMTLPSGAGHDAMVMAAHLPTAMLFVPSIGGRSHVVSEDTAEADIVIGAEVLAETLRMILDGETGVPL
jgi:N-carbamoyl-L-amino-acid hydrolase